jgi:hypothetical protein
MKSLVTSIMIVEWTFSRHLGVPIPDAMQMKSAEALQPGHILTWLVLLEADAAFCLLDTILLRGLVGEEGSSEPLSTR